MNARFNALAPWARITIKVGAAVLVALLVYFLITSAFDGIKHAIFGNPEVKRAQAETIVAEEQIEAEAEIADSTLETVRERDVYREHFRTIVRDSQERINVADQGQQMDPEIDAAVAAGLCRVHDDLCRGAGAAPVQPVR